MVPLQTGERSYKEIAMDILATLSESNGFKTIVIVTD